MSKKSLSARDAQRNFQRYLDEVAPVFGHADRVEPFEAYCKGLLLPGDRKSVEPMAARLAPSAVRSKHQSMHHFVATASWNAQRVLDRVAQIVIPVIEESGPITSWIIDDTGIPKKGEHSVGVSHQYCGQLGKQANCQVAVTLSVANAAASLPIAHQLYLPESWAQDGERREKVGVPKEIGFRTKLELALEQLQHAVASNIPPGVVLADAAYGNAAEFREGVTKLGLSYALAVQSTTNVWQPGQSPLTPKGRTSTVGRPPSAFRQTAKHHPISVLELARELPASAYRTVTWREGTNAPLSSRFAAVRIRVWPGRRPKSTMPPQEWLVIEWPSDQEAPIKFWLATLAANTPLKKLVASIMGRWRIERDYQELKSELGLGQYEGRSWLGFHHHAALCITAYGFLLLQRGAFPPSEITHRLSQPPIPQDFKPRGSPNSSDTP